MLKRILRGLIAFAAIVAVYQAYVLLAVPWMEPPISHRQASGVTSDKRYEANLAVSKYQRMLSAYFGSDHWSQKRPPKVIASSNEKAMLVLDDYERHEDGRVEIERFALLIFPTPLREGITPPRDAIVLEAPQGAKLQFDEFRPERGEIGRITRGEFPGRITIRSDMREPGAEDDLLIETADLLMNTKLLYTTSPVRFRMGKTVGGGTGMEIRFMDDEQSPASNNGLKIAGIDGLEIRQDVRAQIFLETASLLPGDEQQMSKPKEPSSGPSSQGTEDKDAAPVEVTCSGPFHFDFVRYVASFDRDVELRQLSTNGPSDQLSAQQLDIHFAPRQTAGNPAEAVVVDAGKRQQRELGRLEPVTVVAQGHPVVVTSPSRNAEARGGRVQLGLHDRRVVISGGPDVQLTYGSNVLRAPAIEYQHPARDAGTRIGRFRAKGPGTLDYVFDPAKPEQVFRATWQVSVELGRYQGQPVLTLVGRPQMGLAGMGAMEADQIQVFVREVEGDAAAGGVPLPGEIGGKGKLQIVPDRLAASGGVAIESRELTGNTDELEATFRVERPSAAEHPVSGSAARPSTAAGETVGASGLHQRFDLSRVSDQRQQRYHIDADRLNLQMAVHGERMEPTNLSCHGNVLFREVPLVAMAEKPLEVRGQQLNVDNLNSDMMVTILGSASGQLGGALDAQVAARGMTVLAGKVQLNQRENRLWIEGPGKANMLVSRDLAGKPATTAFPLDITWQGGLDFDGDVVNIDRNVQVQGADDWVHCERLKARLNQRVKFGERIEQKAIDLSEVECQGQVMLDHRSRDELGLSAHHRMKLGRLSINQQTGAISGDGPGEIRSTHFSDQMSSLIGPPPGGQINQVALPPGARGAKLNFLRIDFQRGLSGNLYQRDLRFSERVRAVYGPVDSWEQELDVGRGEGLSPESMTLNCDDLILNEDPLVSHAAAKPNVLSGRPLGPMQMRANGNVQIEGQATTQGRFGARADSVSYDQSKDVLLLTGSTRSPAQVWQRRGPGDQSPPYQAQEIRYVRSTGEMRGTGIPYLEYVPSDASQNARAPGPQAR